MVGVALGEVANIDCQMCLAYIGFMLGDMRMCSYLALFPILYTVDSKGITGIRKAEDVEKKRSFQNE